MQIKTKKEVILESLQKIKGVSDFTLITKTEKVALKKSRTTKTATPDRFSKITKVKLATVSLGNDYEDEVNNRLLNEGKDANFKAKGTYCAPLAQIETRLFESLLKKLGISFQDKFSKIIFKHMEKDQFYIRIYPNLAKEYFSENVYFDVNGDQLTEEEFKAIEAEYLTLPSKSSQGGLENKIIVNNYKLENVLYLGDDDKNPINELTEEKLSIFKKEG